MSLLSHQLQTKRYQKELGIDNRTFNALDVKHSDINLLKQLQLLNPKVSAPPASAPAPAPAGDTGFWGDFLVINGTQSGSSVRHMNAYLAFNNVALTNSVQINGNQSHTFTIQEQDRLPLPSSTLQLKVTMQSGTQELDLGASDGFSITNFTDNPPTQENTLNMLVNSNNINDGNCAMTFLVTYVPPGWSGTITFVKQAGGGSQHFITIKTETGPFIATDYRYNSGSNVFSVSLASPSSYVYIQIYGAGGWDITNNSFSQAVGSPTYVRENNRLWERYTIPSQFIGSNLTYNFSTYYND